MTTNTPPDISKCTVLTGFSRTEIEQKIDAFLAEEKRFRDIPLILPVTGAIRYSHRGITIREWYMTEQTVFGAKVYHRFDSAVELTD